MVKVVVCSPDINDYACSTDFTFPLARWCQCSLQPLIQPLICGPGTYYGWVDQGSVEYEVYATLPHMTSAGNRTPDNRILSPMLYPLGQVFPSTRDIKGVMLPSTGNEHYC